MITTFNTKDFPKKTQETIKKLIEFLATDFRRGVITSSEEDDARIDLITGLEENCLQNPDFKQNAKDFAEARKIFKTEISIFLQTLEELENKTYTKLKEFKELQKIAT